MPRYSIIYLYSVPNKPILLDISYHGKCTALSWLNSTLFICNNILQTCTTIIISLHAIDPHDNSNVLLWFLSRLLHTSYSIPLLPSSNSVLHLWTFLVILSGIMVANHHKPETYADLEALPEYEATKHIFQKAGWEPFFKKFDGYDD